MDVSRARQAIFAALKTASPHEFNDDLRRAFLSDGLNLNLADLEMVESGSLAVVPRISSIASISRSKTT